MMQRSAATSLVNNNHILLQLVWFDYQYWFWPGRTPQLEVDRTPEDSRLRSSKKSAVGV